MLYERFHQIVSKKGLLAVDSNLSRRSHMAHCVGAVNERDRSPHDLNTFSNIKYPDCGVLRWKD